MSHPDALIFSGQQLDVAFRMTRPLTDFMATLHKNGVEEKKLSKYVTQKVTSEDQVVVLSVSFPEEGQYGMDVYTREVVSNGEANGEGGEKRLRTHCCKYLINSSRKHQ